MVLVLHSKLHLHCKCGGRNVHLNGNPRHFDTRYWYYTANYIVNAAAGVEMYTLTPDISTPGIGITQQITL